MRISVRHMMWAVGVLLLVGCSSTPRVQVWQPWTRVNGEIGDVEDLIVDVRYESGVLPGSYGLLEDELGLNVVSLLQRRGIGVESQETGTSSMKISVVSTRRDRIRTGYETQVRYSVRYLGASSRTTTSTGVAIAALLSSLAVSKEEQAFQYINTMEGYTHTVAAEIFSSSGSAIWKGEASWDSSSPDVRQHFVTALQLLFTTLPSDSNVHPHVHAVAEEKGNNYLEINCIKRWFTCPALPYNIAFSNPHRWATSSTDAVLSSSSRCVKDEVALDAYLDLIQTAEYAVPGNTGMTFGRGVEYDDPLDTELWKKVQLGGVYDLAGYGSARILVDLKGYLWGYQIQSCRIADDEEWAKHLELKGKWEEALADYYNYYIQN